MTGATIARRRPDRRRASAADDIGGAPDPPRRAPGGVEAAAFRGATAVAALHALDDAVLHRGPGLGVGQHAVAAAIALAAAAAGAIAFPRLRAGLRAALAAAFGVLALVNGAMHVAHLRVDGPAASDVTGVLAAAAGVVLLAVAAAIPWRRRGERAAAGGRRHAARGVAVVGGLLGAFYLALPLGMAIVDAHKWREPVGPAPTGYADVAFRATDGLRLAGWYRPTTNGATVLVVHGGNSDRRGSLTHARMLARQGYGVLLYDARGRGESEGSPNGFGWKWTRDIAGALAFLRSRDEVDPARIGAVGLSTGADALLEAAATRRDLRALVTDGAAAGSFADVDRLMGTDASTPVSWLHFAALRVLTGDPPGPALADLMPRIAAPVLLISAGKRAERDFNVLYDRVGGDRVEHWSLPAAHHTDAIREYPRDYERRVVGFLDRALR